MGVGVGVDDEGEARGAELVKELLRRGEAELGGGG